jgi:uncharacterized RDD family membrane protein YckC
MPEEELEYVGFWPRVGASIIDTMAIVLVVSPLLVAFYGKAYFSGMQAGILAGPADFLISWVMPAVAVIAFWLYKQATPGKMVISARVVDAATGGPLTTGQAIGRYFGYFVSSIPFGLGLVWVAFDSKKQGWHDKMAGTVVVRSKKQGAVPVTFGKP